MDWSVQTDIPEAEAWTHAAARHRMGDVLARHDRRGEIAIATAQTGICLFIFALHVGAQIGADWHAFNWWLVGALTGILGTSLCRYLVRAPARAELALNVLNVADVALLLVLIWSSQYAYGHPASGALKAPTFGLLLVFVALRSLRFAPRPIVVTGLAAACGWVAMVALVLAVDGLDVITHDFAQYLATNTVLLGAEVERVCAIGFLTFALALATSKARELLSRSTHAEDYREALEAARINLSEAERAGADAARLLASLAEREAQLSQQNQRFDAALDHMSQGVCMFDRDKTLVVCNTRYLEMYNLPDWLAQPGTAFRTIVEARVATGNFAGDQEDYMRERLKAVEIGKSTTKIQTLSDGRVISIRHQPMKSGGWVATHEDITEMQRAQAEIAHMAHHDALTDLPNRVLLRNHLDDALSQMAGDRKMALLCLDLDRFKNVNDTLGHPKGDVLLKSVAHRLRGCVGPTDVVARLGGDEFAILQTGGDQPKDATRIAARVCEELSVPFELGDHQVVVGASVGIAVAPGDGADPDELIKNADLALYRAKADGRGVYRFFEPGMDARMLARRHMELDLRAALEAGEFTLHYQPLVNLDSGEITGFEALLRWCAPDRGYVPPDEFIPMAEEIGLIIPLGEWVIRQACEDAVKWPYGIKVAVNLSPAQFRSGNLAQTVFSALANSKLAPGRLELEITENALLENNETTLTILHQLRDMGVRIAMDDFGTGYSSLSYLKSFPFDKIKLDRSFVSDISEREDAGAIVKAVASLSHSLGMTTTAEGVETQAQRDYVRAAGYTEMQGYFVSAARPADEIARTFFAKAEPTAQRA